MTSHRSEMVGGMLRELLSRLLHEDARDPRLALVSVTEVAVSKDLSHARVYVSKIGSDAERAAAVAALNHAAPYFRREIARRTRLRKAPELAFATDDALEGGFRVTRLLDEIQRERESTPAGDGEEPS
jgi:ribosome-binding factor A